MSTWPATRKRPSGRHTSLIDGGDDPGPAVATIGDWPLPGLAGPPDDAGYTAHGSRAGMAEPSSLSGAGTRVWIRGEDPADRGRDTMVLSDPGLFRPPPPGIGLNRPVPPARWYQRRWWLLAMVAGLTAVICMGFLEMPPLLAAVGIDAPPACQLCHFPLPSSPPVGPATGSSPVTPSPAISSPAPPARTATPSAPPPVRVVAPQPTATTPDTPPTVSATYTATPAGGSGFTGQITVTNRGTAAITGWNLVVALPGDTVSAVQNAEFTDDNDVLFMTAAPYDLSIGPGSTATITIYASGPDSTPAECSFNDVACQ